jgi:Bardet-Biedl syndrome 9 protein
MAVDMHQSLIADPNIVIIPSVSNTSESLINEIIIWKDSELCPASTKVCLIATYINEDGAPRIASKSFHIPINIFVKLGSPTKEAEHKISFDVINSGQSNITLSDLFSDLYDNESSNLNSLTNNTIALEIIDEQNIVSIMTSVKSVNQKFVVQSDSFGALAFIANELLRRLDRNNIKYDTSKMDLSFIPLNKLFVLIDQHLLARYQVIDLQNSLSSYSAQFRAIQKRLLIKLKDRNPTPLNNLETLLKVAQTQVICLDIKKFKPSLDLNQV